MKSKEKTVYFILQFMSLFPGFRGNWEEWWTYDGISVFPADAATCHKYNSGPEFWGLLNPNWSMCAVGRRQSPVNVEPDKLVYDPHLRHIHVDKHRVSGDLYNTGQSIIFRIDKDSKHYVNITGGPLVYKYRFEELRIHFGIGDMLGSEHQINGNAFPGELQIYGFNAELFRNMSEARFGSNGIVGISVMIQVNDAGNDEMRILSSGFSKVVYRGEKWPVKHLSLGGLLPKTHHYMTYDGSTTHPGCWETTTWIIMNKPAYVTTQELYTLRQLMQGDRISPKVKMANNFRTVKSLHHRTIRTNIDFTNADGSKRCPSMYREMYYATRKWPSL